MSSHRDSASTKFLHTLPSFVWLTFVWCALWRTFDVPNLIFGAIFSVLVLSVFRLPTLYLSNRFNLWFALRFAVYFVFEVARASWQMLWLACTFRPPLQNSVVAVQLRTHSDLWITAISHAMSLIPGSLVVEVDRSLSVLYFHVIHTPDQSSIERFIAQTHKVESMILKAVGNRDEIALIQAEEADETELLALEHGDFASRRNQKRG